MSPIILGLIVLLLVIVLPMSVKIVPEYERGVLFRLGRLVGQRGPGLFLIIPFVDRMVKVDLRVVTMDVPSQEVITKDNVTVRVNAVIYFRVINPQDAVVKVLDHIRATSQIGQTTLRNVLGQHELDELLSEREKLNEKLTSIIDENTDPWGVKVSMVEIKEVELAEQMKRMMAAQAEAERDRRAKIIHADGEFQASERLAEAGAVIGKESTSTALQLRYLQTMLQVAGEKNSIVIFPIPIDIISAFMKKASSSSSSSEGDRQ
ncbi:MAG: slipin family protein [Dehalococcoidales bacterium]|nr:slipin family protein [Dehalococcoidales bacterium]